MEGPDSSYSSLVIHISSKVESEDRIDPPIQTEYLRSGGAMILMVMLDGARASISAFIRSSILGNIVDPPDMKEKLCFTALDYESELAAGEN
jgi:hypothetical protein